MSRAKKSTGAFSELLNPVKDPESSFNINISELLQVYIRSFVEGSINFNSAALVIQGSASHYCKKVEYLHNLATRLYASLLKNKKEEVAKKDPKEKEKHTRGNKFSDPFCSTEIKLGKNLSCLRKKFTKSAANKKASKKSDKKYTYVPVDLIPIESSQKSNEEEEEQDGRPRNEMELLGTQGNDLGKPKDSIVNKCKVMSSGWLLLPTTSPDLIPSLCSNEDYTIADDYVDDNMCDSSPVDEGYPPSSGCSETPPSVPSSQDPSSVPSSQSSDEGFVGSSPMEYGSQPETGTPAEAGNPSNSDDPTTGIPMETIQGTENSNQGMDCVENIPLENDDLAIKPRRSMRQALKLCQLQEENSDPKQVSNSSTPPEKEVAVVKRAIQKKNTCNLPSKLKANDVVALRPASEFCARTFFSMDRSYARNSPIDFEVCAFRNNSKLFARFRDIQTRMRGINQKKRAKANAPAADENQDIDDDDDDSGNDVDIGNDAIERNLEDPVTNADILTSPLEAADIVIENNPSVSDNENPLAEDEPIFEEGNRNGFNTYSDKELEDSFTNAARLQCDLFREDLHKYVQMSDISKRVSAWEVTMKPYLEGLSKREEFDINLYGSRILNAFENSNRKQTITFRDFCKGKEKWQIHRYFMALLPLVNIGNVSIEAQPLDEEEEDIAITLLSRKMHHKELEEFGHKEGEHS